MYCMITLCVVCYFFFFKQKTAYEMRISDWSSDVCSSDLTEALVERVAADFGISAIVHSAGLFPQAGLAATSLQLWDSVMAVNLRAAFVLARAGTQAMQGDGSLIFLTSGAGEVAGAAEPFMRPFEIGTALCG